MSEDNITDIPKPTKLAKTSAILHLEEAVYWVQSTPVDYDAYERLYKAIAVELLERAGLPDEQKRLIQLRWPLFRPDPITETMRRVAEAIASDKQSQEALRRFCQSVMED